MHGAREECEWNGHPEVHHPRVWAVRVVWLDEHEVGLDRDVPFGVEPLADFLPLEVVAGERRPPVVRGRGVRVDGRGRDVGARLREGTELEVDILDTVPGVEVRRGFGVAEDDRAAPGKRVTVSSEPTLDDNNQKRDLSRTYRSLASHTTECRSLGTMSAVILRSTPAGPSINLAAAFTLRGGVRIFSCAHSCKAASTMPPMNVRPGARSGFDGAAAGGRRRTTGRLVPSRALTVRLPSSRIRLFGS